MQSCFQCGLVEGYEARGHVYLCLFCIHFISKSFGISISLAFRDTILDLSNQLSFAEDSNSNPVLRIITSTKSSSNGVVKDINSFEAGLCGYF